MYICPTVKCTIHRIIRNYVGAMCIKLPDRMSVRKTCMLETRHEWPTRLDQRGRASELLGSMATRFHIGGSRSVDASWGTRYVGRIERDGRAQGRKSDRGGNSARGIPLKVLTRGPRHATSELHQDSINGTGGRGASRKVLYHTALPSTSADKQHQRHTHPDRLQRFGTRVSDACILTFGGPESADPDRLSPRWSTDSSADIPALARGSDNVDRGKQTQ